MGTSPDGCLDLRVQRFKLGVKGGGFSGQGLRTDGQCVRERELYGRHSTIILTFNPFIPREKDKDAVHLSGNQPGRRASLIRTRLPRRMRCTRQLQGLSVFLFVLRRWESELVLL